MVKSLAHGTSRYRPHLAKCLHILIIFQINQDLERTRGVKGLEFPRVMLILDDEEARGFLFSYEKLLGTKDLTDRDRSNLAEGKDSSIERTRCLFYVTCSRTEESLAIVAYTKHPEKISNYAIGQGWFSEEEVVVIPSAA